MKKKYHLFYPIIALFLLLSPSGVSAAPARDANSEKNFQQAEAEDSKQQQDEATNAYRIGPQNMLQIRIFGEAGINQLYRVDEDGFIKHALGGRMEVGGLTVTEAEALVEKKLDGDYVINPQINIFVLEFSQFSIIGEVRKPGNYEISGRVSIIRAISMAGGFTPIADQRGVQIIRKNSTGTETKLKVDVGRIMQGGQSSPEEDLQADDVVVVPKSFF